MSCFSATVASRLRFSTAATADWFKHASAHYYLLGFSYFENALFAEGLPANCALAPMSL